MAQALLRHPWRAAACAVVLAACDPQYEAFGIEAASVVVTIVDHGPALETARTFVLPDTIIEIPRDANSLAHESDREIVGAVRAHLVSLGWRDLGSSPEARPDVVLLVAAATRVQTGVAYGDWYGAWGYLPYWGPSVGPTWGWGVPVGVPYAYQAGTVLVTMLDLRDQRADAQQIPLLWAAAIDGAVSVNAKTTADRAIKGLDQAFAQSAYLRIGP